MPGLVPAMTDSPMTFVNRVQERLARGEVALCMATRLARTAEIAMIADSCGFDAFFIDMEHCTISLDDAAQICVAALPVGVTPLVRIAGRHFEDATRLLDAGALGIICPNVSTRDEAESFVRACRFRRWANARSPVLARCKATARRPSPKSTSKATPRRCSLRCWKPRKA